MIGNPPKSHISRQREPSLTTRVMRLILDFLGTEFDSRHQQYEKFYGGASFLVKQNVYRNFDFKRATALVDRALNLPPLD